MMIALWAGPAGVNANFLRNRPLLQRRRRARAVVRTPAMRRNCGLSHKFVNRVGGRRRDLSVPAVVHAGFPAIRRIAVVRSFVFP